MRPARLIVVFLLIGPSLTWRCTRDEPAEVVEVTAFELHRAFRTDPDSARAEFEGRDLYITGEVAHAIPRFRGTTMSGEVTMPAKVMFKTEVDTLPHDVKYVEVEGAFDAPDSLELWVVDPRIHEGGSLRVSCPRVTIRWTDPGLYISDCRIASD